MSDIEKPNGDNKWRGVDLSGRGIDPGKAEIMPNGDIWQENTLMGNAYDMSTDHNSILGGSGGQDYDVMASVRLVVILGVMIFIGCWCYTGYLRISHWFKDVTGETGREQIAGQKAEQAKAEEDAGKMREIEASRRYRWLASQFSDRHAAQTALIQQDINMLDELNAQANRTNASLQNTGTHTWSRIGTKSLGRIPVNGVWSRDWDWKAYAVCKVRYGDDDCQVPINDTVDVTTLFIRVDNVLQQVVTNCFVWPDADTPACVKAVEYMQMRDGSESDH